MTDPTHEILVVDDEEDIRMLIAGVLTDEGYMTREAGDSDAALREVDQRRPSLVVLDIWLQGSPLDGLEILKVLKRDYAEIPVIMISGHGNVETAVAAIKEGAYDYIEKPFKSDRLLHMTERAIEAARLKRENLDLRRRAGGDVEMVGNSAAIRQVRAAINRVAPTGSRVLISGPAGSGKEVAARLIHAESGRAQGPFVAINCASMHPDRLAEVLFGIEGSTQPRHTGLFETAHNGTLFLDEVGDMPLETQGKIVRVLQEQTFERVGGGTVFIKADVAVEADVAALIAATVERHGRIDALFNNAGGPAPTGPIAGIDMADYHRAMDVLLAGVVHGMKHAAPVMTAQGSGSIINNGSIAGHQAGWSSSMIYSAAKAAVIHLSRCAAMELGEKGVRVNSVSPGAIATGIFGKALGLPDERAETTAKAMEQAFATIQPIKRAGLPDDIAHAALFLASDESSFVNGRDIVVDGGLIGGRQWSALQQGLGQLKAAFDAMG